MARHFFSFTLLLFSVFLSPLFAQSQPAQNSSNTTVSSAYGQKLQISGISNAGKINDRLYRGAQPQPQGFLELKKLGITTVVDLRREGQGTIDSERKNVESQGMHFVHIPVGGFSAPTDEQIVRFLSLFNGSNEKIFVHCHYGEDRTGVFIASYRMALEKWPAEQAVHEMYFFGFNGHLQPRMKGFARSFPSRLTMAPAYSFLKVTPAPAENPH